MAFHVSKTSILSTLDYIEDGRADIYKWSEKRRSKRKGISGRLYHIQKLFIDRSVLKSFLQNLTIIVILQMVLAALGTFLCQRFALDFDVNISIFVSPIVFPLAFSINADFQRRERVLEDLAEFKGALLVLFFCHRDWIQASGLPTDFLRTVNTILKGLVLNIKEYLLTEKVERRNYILKVIYEDLSDISQLNDRVRGSSLPNNSPLITRLIHYHNLMCHSFERLRVIREYRSPRTIRSFTKVFIFIMPIVLSPYYVHMGINSGNTWSPYYIAILSTFIFGSLQGVQDILDDPFDGISEDDINLGQLEDWTSHSLLTNRCITVGRFTVTTTGKDSHGQLSSDSDSDENPSPKPKIIQPARVTAHKRKSILRKASFRRADHNEEIADEAIRRKSLYPETAHRLEDLARQGMTGSTTILPGMKLKRSNSDSLTAYNSGTSLAQEFSKTQGEGVSGGDSRESKRVWFLKDTEGSSDADGVYDSVDAGSEYPLPISVNSVHLRPDWTLDENSPLISLDSSSGTVTSSLVDPIELSEELCEELKHHTGTSLIKGRFSVDKPEGNVPPSLANLFHNQPNRPPDEANDPHPSQSSQEQNNSMPSSLRNLFAPLHECDANLRSPVHTSLSSTNPPGSTPSSSQNPDFSVSRISHSAPTSPEQGRKRNSLRKLFGQPSPPPVPVPLTAITSQRSADYPIRKKSASLRFASNTDSAGVSSSRFALQPSAHTPVVSSSKEHLTSPSQRKKSLEMSKITTEHLTDNGPTSEKKEPSRPVDRHVNSRFSLSKPSENVTSAQKENQPLVKTGIPNYGITDPSPPPSVSTTPSSRFQVKPLREISEDTKQPQAVEDATGNDSYELLSVDGESSEVFI